MPCYSSVLYLFVSEVSSLFLKQRLKKEKSSVKREWMFLNEWILNEFWMNEFVSLCLPVSHVTPLKNVFQNLGKVCHFNFQNSVKSQEIGFLREQVKFLLSWVLPADLSYICGIFSFGIKKNWKEKTCSDFYIHNTYRKMAVYKIRNTNILLYLLSGWNEIQKPYFETWRIFGWDGYASEFLGS